MSPVEKNADRESGKGSFITGSGVYGLTESQVPLTFRQQGLHGMQQVYDDATSRERLFKWQGRFRSVRTSLEDDKRFIEEVQQESQKMLGKVDFQDTFQKWQER
ncbi:hypothetical protein AVEN_112833-1 [Araneus ventricosus]|uniref:Uncharacterized protein n=1 Tax=Araneus ventricosus TaxID=182803 RepID=A0A4Y2NIP2_ARAVE|nr:hypothetical protein AVEN_112833-1 [Araneus ventricosus]